MPANSRAIQSGAALSTVTDAQNIKEMPSVMGGI
jgi:hypothetical protein